MTPQQWVRVQAIFDDAVAMPGPERRRFLDKACAGDPTLLAEVAALLAAHDRAGDFLEAPAFEAAAHLFVDEPSESSEPQSIGPYVIRHEIGRGGMGVVYLADDTRLGRRVALKALSPAAATDPRLRERLRHEARAAASLSHPGIATVYAIEEIGNELYLACEYVPGSTLRTLIQRGNLPSSQIVDVALQLARALAVAHAHGVVHGDIKPENIICTGTGVVKILDFGIARVDALVSTGVPGGSAGTPGYMAPEQLDGQIADFRSDLYAYGVLLREITSHMPAPGGLTRIAGRCMREDPADRYASTEQLVLDLERVRPGAPAADPGRRHARWWWEFHQATASAVYAVTMYPAWRVRGWLPEPWGMLFFFAVLACAATAISLRLHLWFTARCYPGELERQRSRAAPLIRWTDAGFATLLLLGALGAGTSHPEIATLLVTVAVAAAATSFMIEPTTTKAAFHDS